MNDYQAPFCPPLPSLPGKPSLPTYIAPAPTKLPLNFANLTTIKLSQLSPSTSSTDLESLIATTKEAISQDGFLFLEDYGVTVEQLERQFAIAQFLHESISGRERGEEGEDVEGSLLWNPDCGKFAGWKRGFGWKVSCL